MKKSKKGIDEFGLSLKPGGVEVLKSFLLKRLEDPWVKMEQLEKGETVSFSLKGIYHIYIKNRDDFAENVLKVMGYKGSFDFFMDVVEIRLAYTVEGPNRHYFQLEPKFKVTNSSFEKLLWKDVLKNPEYYGESGKKVKLQKMFDNSFVSKECVNLENNTREELLRFEEEQPHQEVFKKIGKVLLDELGFSGKTDRG